MIKKIYCSGTELLEEQYRQREQVRQLAKKSHYNLLHSHCLSLGIIKTIYYQYLGKPGRTDSSISARLPLIASFIQGIDICEICISEGLYTQAAVILKQELETVAAVNECVDGNRVDLKTPNVKFVEFGLNKEYGLLNGIGHLSNADIFEELFKVVDNSFAENQHPISIVPQHNDELYSHFFAMHILLILQIINQLNNLYCDMYGYKMPEEIKQSIAIIYNDLYQQGIIKQAEEK